MKYEVWTDDQGVSAMMFNLDEEERHALKEVGLMHELTLGATTDKEAQAEFVKWCRKECPTATVKAIDMKQWARSVSNGCA